MNQMLSKSVLGNHLDRFVNPFHIIYEMHHDHHVDHRPDNHLSRSSMRRQHLSCMRNIQYLFYLHIHFYNLEQLLGQCSVHSTHHYNGHHEQIHIRYLNETKYIDITSRYVICLHKIFSNVFIITQKRLFTWTIDTFCSPL